MPGHVAVRVSRWVSKRQIERLGESSGKMNAKNQFSRSNASETEAPKLNRRPLIVILLPEVRNQALAHHPAKSIFQLHELYEQIMLGIQTRRGHRRLEIETQPLLNTAHARA